MIGTVLVIYYKQISEGYEDRERLLILQRLAWTTNKSSNYCVNKSLLSSSSLLIFWLFIHLAFCFHHMIRFDCQPIYWVLNPDLMLVVTIIGLWRILPSLCLGFALTSRSYRRIVSM